MSICSFFLRKWSDLQFKKAWRKANAHNGTYPKGKFPMDQVTVGKKTYGCLDIQLDNDSNKLQIGNYCSIAAEIIVWTIFPHSRSGCIAWDIL